MRRFIQKLMMQKANSQPVEYGGLCFTVEQANSTVALNKYGSSAPTVTLQYSTDSLNWTDYTWTELSGTVITLSNVGDKVWFRAGENGNTTFGSSTSNYHRFVMSGKIAASGNIMSLLDRTLESKTLSESYTFSRMFIACTSLTQAPELPATTLAEYCYRQMFYGCTSLTQAPELPATTLATQCYYSMFQNCTSLTQAPELPATTLAEYCYYQMFYNCTSLTQAPELPATTLAEYCYYSMFQNCTSLTQAPELPATTLAEYCYRQMFYACTSLTQAPELPATTLAEYCYYRMFNNCKSLTQAPELPATTLAAQCYYQMFYACTKLKISENGTSGTKILDLTSISSITSNAVYNMFKNTGGTFTGTPTVGNSYWCYE